MSHNNHDDGADELKMQSLRDETLTRFYQQFHADHERLRGQLLEQLDERQRTVIPHSNRRRRWIMRGTLSALAAAILVGAILLAQMMFASPATLHAEVVKAMRAITSVHAMIREYRDDQLYTESEQWYEKGVGFAEQETVNGQTRLTIEDGEQVWWYTPGEPLAARSKAFRPIDDLGGSGLDLEVVQLADLLKYDPNPQRDPSGDKDVNGSACKLYIVHLDGLDTRVWIDDQTLIRAVEAQSWSQRPPAQDTPIWKRNMTIDYDVSIDSARFKPVLEPGVKVVEPAEYLREQFPAERAIYRRNVAGLVFAVHEFNRLRDDGLAYMVASTRVSDELAGEWQRRSPMEYLGEAHVAEAWGEEQLNCRVETIADLRFGDVHVNWFLIYPLRGKDRLEDECHLGVNASAANELEKLVKQSGGSAYERFDLTLKLPSRDDEAAQLESLDSYLADLHERASTMRPVVFGFGLRKVVPNKKGNGVLTFLDPQRYPVQEFIANTKHTIESRR